MSEIKDRVVNQYQQFIDQNPTFHRILILAARVSGILFSMLVRLVRRHLAPISLFTCFLIFLFVLYFSHGLIFEIFLVIVIYVVACIGLSYLDYTEKLYEDAIEAKQLEDTRRLLTLGVDQIAGRPLAPKLPESSIVQSYKPHQIAIGNILKGLARSNGLVIELQHIESLEQLDEYVFKAKNAVKGTSDLKVLNKVCLQLQNNLSLKGLPKITANGDEIMLSIYNQHLPEDLITGQKNLPNSEK